MRPPDGAKKLVLDQDAIVNFYYNKRLQEAAKAAFSRVSH